MVKIENKPIPGRYILVPLIIILWFVLFFSFTISLPHIFDPVFAAHGKISQRASRHLPRRLDSLNALSPYDHCQERVQNGDFETGDFAPWQPSGDVTLGTGRNSAYSAKFDGAIKGQGKLTQDISLVGDAGTAQLSFWWWAQGSSGKGNDQTTLTVQIKHDGVIETLQSSPVVSPFPLWHRASFDVSRFLGSDILLIFEVTTDIENPTIVKLDDISLTVCPPPTPTPEPLCVLEDISPGPGSVPSSGSSNWGRMLSLSISGSEGVSGPATSWLSWDGDKLVEHLAAADQDGHLILYYAIPEVDWRAVNITEKTGATIAIERPESWMFTDTVHVLERIAAPGPDGDLMLFTWHAGSDWRAENLSDTTGKRIVGPVTSWQTVSNAAPVRWEHIAARGVDNHLWLFSRQTGGDWSAEDISANTLQGEGDPQEVGGPPASLVYHTGEREYIAAPAPNGDLLLFSRIYNGSWHVDNLTEATGQKVASAAAIWFGPGTAIKYLAARAPNNDLIVFAEDPAEGAWFVENVTAVTGKKIYSEVTSWQRKLGASWQVRLAALTDNNQLVVFTYDRGHWIAKTLNWTITHTPTPWMVEMETGDWQEKLAAPSEDGHLHVFTYTPEPPRWENSDISLKATGRTIYAASEKAGAWFSRDYGRFWRQSTRPQPPQGYLTQDGLNSPNILDVAVSPEDPRLVLAALSSNNRRNSLAGIYRSDDGGNSWQRVHTFFCDGNTQPATQLLFAPGDPQTIYAAGGCALAVSHDRGLNWTEIAPADKTKEERIWHVEVSPELANHQRNIYICGSGSFWFSTDSGRTWHRDMGAFQTLPRGFCGKTSSGPGNGVHVLALEPNNPFHIYLANPRDANGPAYFHPHDKYGADGVRCNNPLIYDVNDNQRFDVGDISILGRAPTPNAPLKNDHKIKYVDRNHNGRYDKNENEPLVYDSNDNGKFDENNEVKLAGASPSADDALVIDNRVRYVDLGVSYGPKHCGEGSLWLGDFTHVDPASENPQAVWTQLPGPPVYWEGGSASGAVFVYTLPIPKTHLVFFADQDTLHVSVGKPTAGGWHRLDGWDASRNRREHNLHNHAFVHVDPHDMAVSPDFRLTLRAADADPPYNMNKELESCLGGRLWLANDGGVYRSDDCGESWTPAQDGLDTLAAINLAGIAVPGKAPALYFGTGDNDDFYSIDGGATWRSGCDSPGDAGAWFADPALPTQVIGFSRTTPVFGVYRNKTGYPDPANCSQLYRPPRPEQSADAKSTLILGASHRPIIQTMAGESPEPDGDYILIMKIETDDDSARWVLYRAKNSIHRSLPWEPMAPDLPAHAKSVQAAGGHATPTLYVQDKENHLWKSQLNAAGKITGWDEIVPGGSATKALRFFVNPYDPNDIYIIDTNAIRHSVDGGRTWPIDPQLDPMASEGGLFNYSGGEDRSVLQEMIFDREHPSIRFAAGLAGVFYSPDGANWYRLVETRALPSHPSGLYFDPLTDPDNPALYITFHGRSIMRCRPIPSQLPPPRPTPTPTITPSPTPSPTPTPGLPGPGRNILSNSGFESGVLAPWQGSGIVYVSSKRAHRGQSSVVLGDEANNGELAQTLAIPQDIAGAILSYWWRIESEDVLPMADSLQALVQWDNGSMPLETLTNSEPRFSWRSSRFDLTFLRGKQITIVFLSRENAEEPTLFYLDDIRLDITERPIYLPMLLHS